MTEEYRKEDLASLVTSMTEGLVALSTELHDLKVESQKTRFADFLRMVGMFIFVIMVMLGVGFQSRSNGKVLERTDKLLKFVEVQNRNHRIDNHAENSCALQLLSEAFRNNPLYKDIPLPTIEADVCEGLIVTKHPDGLDSKSP